MSSKPYRVTGAFEGAAPPEPFVNCTVTDPTNGAVEVIVVVGVITGACVNSAVGVVASTKSLVLTALAAI